MAGPLQGQSSAERRSIWVSWRNPKTNRVAMGERMPLYEYECPECGRKLELRRGMAEAEQEVRCPECRKGILKRILSIFSTASSGENCAPSGST